MCTHNKRDVHVHTCICTLFYIVTSIYRRV